MRPISLIVRGTANPIFGALFFTVAALYNGPGKAFHLFAVLVVLLATWITWLITRPTFAVSHFPTGWLPTAALLYSIWLFLSPYLSSFPYVSQLQAIDLAVLPLGLLTWWLIPDAEKPTYWSRLWGLLLIAASVLAVWGITDFVIFRERAHNPFVDPNAFAALLNLFAIPLCFHYLTSSSLISLYYYPRLHLATIALFATAQFMTLSRAGLLTAGLVFVIALAFSFRAAEFKRRIVQLLLVLTTCYVAVAHGPIEVSQRDVGQMLLAPGAYLKQNASFQTRLHIWQATWEMAADGNPIFGTGLGTFKVLYPAYRHTEDNNSGGNYAHNDYLQAFQEGGIIQLAFLSFFTLLLPVWIILKKRSSETTGFLLAIICISLHAFLNFIYYITAITFVASLFLGRASAEICKISPRWQTVMLRVRPVAAKTIVVFLLCLMSVGAVLDGVIFAAYVRPRFIGSLSPEQLVPLTNAFIAARPNNPLPREVLIRALIASSDRAGDDGNRQRFIERALAEGESLLRVAPAVPTAILLLAKTFITRDQHGDTVRARLLLEEAIKRAPHSAEIRLELVRLYKTNEKNSSRALAIANGIRSWLFLVPEEDRLVMAALVDDAYQLAQTHGTPSDIKYWHGLRSFLDERSKALKSEKKGISG